MQSWCEISGEGDGAILIVADHASAMVPPEVDLGIDPALLATHIAVDLGVAELAARLCDATGARAILGGVSRLVVDFNREEDAPGLIPIASDGHAIPGNALSTDAREQRIARYWRPYHARIAAEVARCPPALIVSLHSFTPQLASAPHETRPWDVGILYNLDDRAARMAIPLLEAAGACVGDQLPYSGKILNATMNRHAEANDIPYLGIEMRQDRIGDADGNARWAAILAPVLRACVQRLASGTP